ncbi:hypothetical protein BT96DRAFT_937308 [Gymnopus androsaceus JB14]|uniref:CxC2-like cysteine cluster KDZ transposase-associated domain-containing protein n=1 Tax=Gymnopus androsaceus JB14 TaxID=1447944 RepID=A0A6A4HWY1_9AGAR|nr:hypothetical protein BT96DRAFT_937308 [Gymnopus androsaceus JB14]
MSKHRKEGDFYEHPIHCFTAISVSQDARRVNIHSQPLPSLPETSKQQAANFSSVSFSPEDHSTDFGMHPDHWADIAELEGLINDQELNQLQVDEEDDAANITVVKPAPRKSGNPIKAWIPYQDQYLDVMRRNASLLEWQMNHFQITSLKKLGASYQLGHEPGRICHFPKKAHVNFTVVHTNGIHNIAAKFSYDFYKGLEIMTESQVRAKPKHFYSQWCSGDCLKCANGKGKHMVHLEYRELHRIVSNEVKNPLLMDGWAYFVLKSEYAEHLKKYVNQVEVSLECLIVLDEQLFRFCSNVLGKFKEYQRVMNFRCSWGVLWENETVEEGWVSSNKAASQTKEMSTASRALTLDNIFGFYNWQLAQSLDCVLGKHLVHAVKEFMIHDNDFVDFTESLRRSIGEETLNRWDKMIEAWDKDKTMPCLCEFPDEEKMSLKEVKVDLAKEEHEALSWGINVHSSSRCSRALQIKTTPHPTPTQTLELQQDASAILRNIQSFQNFQALLMPILCNHLSEQ